MTTTIGPCVAYAQPRRARRAWWAPVAFGLTPALAGGACRAQTVAPEAAASEQVALGDPHAPVTVDEYASVGCPHCADWANEVFPAFRRKYIDSGQVRFVFHEVLAGDPYLAAAGFLVARCAPREKYFQVVDDIFAEQAGLAREGIDAWPISASEPA